MVYVGMLAYPTGLKPVSSPAGLYGVFCFVDQRALL